MEMIAEAAVGYALSTLLSPEPPKLEMPKKAPTPDEGAMAEAKRRQLRLMQARQGRASTILTEGGTPLGGTPSASTVLGG